MQGGIKAISRLTDISLNFAIFFELRCECPYETKFIDIDILIGVLLEAEISGKALAMIDRSCLKDIGITPIDKQLTILALIKQLLG